MKNKFTLGAISGMSALAIGFPLAAQFVGAQSSSSAGAPVVTDTMTWEFKLRGPMSQEDVQAMADRDTAVLANLDAIVAIHKEAIQARRDALVAAATIADETQRQEAVKAAHEQFHTSMQTAIDAHPELKDAMPMMMFGGKGMHMMKMKHGPHPGMLAEKFGMTPEELRTALESGKTIEQIAEEKGVELPERPMFFFKSMESTSTIEQ